MLAMGLRNHEACGLTWEAIRPLDSSGSVYVAWIYESTVGQTSNLQASGKTKNMARKVPLYPGFAKYLLALKAYRKQQIEEGVIVLEEGESLETLPIVWREKNFKQHCTSGGLSAAGRHLLAEINFGQDRFAALDEDLGEIAAMEEADNDEEWVSLKDPTAYLLRRNFGTHLSVLGFSDDEISYLMGHKIDTDGRNRNMFSNEDQLKIIFRKLNMRPLFGNNDDAKPNQRLSPDIPLIKLDNVWGASITAVAKEKSKAFVRVSLREPDDEATITVKKDPAGTATPISARIYPLPPCVDTETSPMVNNIRMYQEAYRKVRGTKKLFDAF